MSRRKEEVYPSDVSDAQWELLAPVLRRAIGRGVRLSRRALLNAIFYVHRTGCQWRFLPRSYPKWQTVYSCFWRWQQNGAAKRGVGCGLGGSAGGDALRSRPHGFPYGSQCGLFPYGSQCGLFPYGSQCGLTERQDK